MVKVRNKCLLEFQNLTGKTASIAWDVVNNQSYKCSTRECTEEERINADHSPETYLGKVIIPWYRPSPKVCLNEDFFLFFFSLFLKFY